MKYAYVVRILLHFNNVINSLELVFGGVDPRLSLTGYVSVLAYGGRRMNHRHRQPGMKQDSGLHLH